MKFFVATKHYSIDLLSYQSYVYNWKEIIRRRMRYIDSFKHLQISVSCKPLVIAILRVYIYLFRFHFHRAPMYSRWSRPQTLSVLDYQANTIGQEQARCRWTFAPFHAAANIAWLSKLRRVERVNNLSTATTVVDRRCRYSAIEKLTQNTVDCVKSTAD